MTEATASAGSAEPEVSATPPDEATPKEPVDPHEAVRRAADEAQRAVISSLSSEGLGKNEPK
jgi:hypothetical protein